VAGAEETGPTAAERAFVNGWAAFRAGQFADSIASFDQLLHLAPDSAMAEDAEYWRAIAFARNGSAAAAAQLRAFLRKYPRSAHTDDALVALTRCQRQGQ
jgi:TolA-binding protein